MSSAECAIASPKYMMYVVLDKYDPKACADVCTSHSGCDACKATHTHHNIPNEPAHKLHPVNIYIQREPSVEPGISCPNPPAVAVTKCALYSEPVTKNDCINNGQEIGPLDSSDNPFKIIIRGSNGA